MTAVWIAVGGALGLLVAMVLGVVYTVASGGIERGDPGENIVAALLVAGIVLGLVAGWRLS